MRGEVFFGTVGKMKKIFGLILILLFLPVSFEPLVEFLGRMV
jgi:hypothetical protein